MAHRKQVIWVDRNDIEPTKLEEELNGWRFLRTYRPSHGQVGVEFMREE